MCCGTFNFWQSEVEKIYPVNKEQIDFFIQRQKKHEQFVREAADKLAEKIKEDNPDKILIEAITDLLKREVIKHDKSKWYYPEYFPYVWLTWVYNTDNKWPSEELEKKADAAWEHHYLHNKHHPEYWMENPRELKDMDPVSLMHMVCDWAAMSREFNNGLLDWYENNAVKKYEFTKAQDLLIRKYISFLEN